jgi:hypothetical protein
MLVIVSPIDNKIFVLNLTSLCWINKILSSGCLFDPLKIKRLNRIMLVVLYFNFKNIFGTKQKLKFLFFTKSQDDNILSKYKLFKISITTERELKLFDVRINFRTRLIWWWKPKNNNNNNNNNLKRYYLNDIL